MLQYLNHRIRVTINDSRYLIGKLNAFENMTLILGDCVEYRVISPKTSTSAGIEEKRTLGLVLLPGINIQFSMDSPEEGLPIVPLPGGLEGLGGGCGGPPPGLQGPPRGVGGPGFGRQMSPPPLMCYGPLMRGPPGMMGGGRGRGGRWRLGRGRGGRVRGCRGRGGRGRGGQGRGGRRCYK